MIISTPTHYITLSAYREYFHYGLFICKGHVYGSDTGAYTVDTELHFADVKSISKSLNRKGCYANVLIVFFVRTNVDFCVSVICSYARLWSCEQLASMVQTQAMGVVHIYKCNPN